VRTNKHIPIAPESVALEAIAIVALVIALVGFTVAALLTY